MDFKDEFNKTFRITVDSPLEDLAQSEVEDAMASILAHNIFTSNGVDLVSIEGARMIRTVVNELQL